MGRWLDSGVSHGSKEDKAGQLLRSSLEVKKNEFEVGGYTYSSITLLVVHAAFGQVLITRPSKRGWGGGGEIRWSKNVGLGTADVVGGGRQ